MQVDLKKYIFIGHNKCREEFFSKAQRMGIVEFLSSGQILESNGTDKLKKVINLLEDYGVENKKKDSNGKDLLVLVEEVLKNQSNLEKLSEELVAIELEIEKVLPFGDFDIDKVTYISSFLGGHFEFFVNDTDIENKIERENSISFLVGKNKKKGYYLYFGKTPLNSPNKVEIGYSLEYLFSQKKMIEASKLDCVLTFKEQAAYIDLLEDLFLAKINYRNLLISQGFAEKQLEDRIFYVAGWIACDRVGELNLLVKDIPVLYEEISIESTDVKPTYLQNVGIAKIGQDLVEMYDIPSTTDRDSSFCVVLFFSIFFGIIVSDAGYGILFFLLYLLLKKRYKHLEGSSKRSLEALRLLSFTTIVWGVLSASYFSILLYPNNIAKSISIPYNLACYSLVYQLDNGNLHFDYLKKDYPRLVEQRDVQKILEAEAYNGNHKMLNGLENNAFMEIALVIGMLHISFSFFRNLYRSYDGIGWIVAIWGGYLFFPSLLGIVTLVNYLFGVDAEISATVGKFLFFGGICLSFVLSVIQSGILGIKSIFKTLEIFSDILSYLRVYALGMASMIMGATFNDMAIGTGSYVVGGLILFVGHFVNMLLCTMGGLIHGLRLNFLEWYHHSFEGGGFKFNPLRFIKKWR